jgi:hypothetical protein
MKDMKSMKKALTQLQQMKEDDSNISDSDASEGKSHFHFADGGFQFTQVENEFEPQITKLFKQTHGSTKIKLDLREIIFGQPVHRGSDLLSSSDKKGPSNPAQTCA